MKNPLEVSVKLKDVPYKKRFWWKGGKYSKFIQPKQMPKKAFIIPCFCYATHDLIDMPSGREVKPIIRLNKKPLATGVTRG